jgi:catechol 2,3-dioxygenase-like lactoylglutathione lyase family enzyme
LSALSHVHAETDLGVHRVSIMVSDLDRSLPFRRDGAIGLPELGPVMPDIDDLFRLVKGAGVEPRS